MCVSQTPAKPESAETASTAVRAAATSSSTDAPPTVAGPKGNGPWEGSQLGGGHTLPTCTTVSNQGDIIFLVYLLHGVAGL